MEVSVEVNNLSLQLYRGLKYQKGAYSYYPGERSPAVLSQIGSIPPTFYELATNIHKTPHCPDKHSRPFDVNMTHSSTDSLKPDRRGPCERIYYSTSCRPTWITMTHLWELYESIRSARMTCARIRKDQRERILACAYRRETTHDMGNGTDR